MRERLFRKTFFILASVLFFFGCLMIGTKTAHANNCVTTSTAGSYNFNVAADWTNCGGTTPATTDTIEILSGVTTTLVAATQVAGVVIDSGGRLALSSYTLTDAGTGTAPNGFTINGTLSGTGAVTLSGAGAWIDGTGTPSYTGLTTLTGNKTVSSSASLSFAGAITISASATTTNNGTIAMNAIFTDSGVFVNSGAFTDSATTASSFAIAGTFTNNATTTLSGSTTNVVMSGVGTFTNGTNATLNYAGGSPSITTLTATASGNTVNYNGAAVTCIATQYYNLTFGGSGTKTCTSFTSPILGNLVVTGTATWTLGAATTVAGTVTISGGTLTTAGYAFTASSITSISSGGLVLNSSTGNKTLVGLVTVSGGTLSGNSTLIIFQGGLTQSGSGAVTITGTATFGTNSQALNGRMTLGLMTVGTAGITLTNNANVSSTGATLTLTGNWTQGAGSGLEFSVAIATSGTGIFDAHTNNNTVTYDRASTQTCIATQYYNLTFGGSGTKTCTSFTSPILGNLVVTGTATWTLGAATTVAGTVTISGGTLTTAGYAFTASSITSISSGGLVLNSSTGNKTLVGLVTVSGGTLSGNSTLIIFQGGLTQSGSGAVTITGTATFTGNQTLSGTSSITTATLTSGTTLTLTSTSTLTATTFTVPASTTTTNNGTVTMTGAFTDSGVFVNSGAFTDSATTASSFAIAGTFTNNATTTLSGSTTNVVMSGVGTFTNGTNATLNYAGGSPSITTLTATASGNTVNYNGAAVTCKATQYYNLTFGGSGAVTCAPISPILGNLVYGGTSTWTMSTSMTVTGGFTVSGSGGTVTTGAFPFTVNTTTTISAGTLTLNGAATTTLTGLVTLSGGTLNGTSTLIVTPAGITNNGGTVAITGTDTVSSGTAVMSGTNAIAIANLTVTSPGAVTNSSSLAVSGTLTGTGTVTNNGTVTAIGTWSNTGTVTNNGTITATIVTINSPGAVTNNGTTTITGNFTGSGSWTQGNNSLLNAAGTLAIGTLNAVSTGSTMNYNGAGQTCQVTQYYNLTLGGSGTVTCAPTSPILGALTIGAVSWTLGAPLTVNGSFTNGGTFDVSTNNYALTLNGNFTNNGIFTARNGTTTLSGTSPQQTLSGTMTGTSAFYNLVITNSTGTVPSDCEITSFTPSVVFSASATVTNNYTVTTGGVGVQYSNGSTYTFTNTNWVGPSGHPIYFRNSVSSGQWLLNVSGNQTPLAYVNVSRSNASSGPAAISAQNITNRDCGNNSNWSFATSSSPTAYTQAAYQWFANQNSAQVGPTLAVANASTTLISTGEQFRLRMLLAVDATNSIAGADSFALEFANESGYANCSAVPPASYTAITSATSIAFYTNSNVPNGTALAATSTDPVDGGRTVVEETYQSSNNFTPTSTIYAGQDGNWDFSLVDNGSPQGTDYCFEAVFASSTPLYAYVAYPEIVTYGTRPPRIFSALLANGSTTITLSPGGTLPISVIASTMAGGNPIAFATSTIYRTSLGPNCVANNKNCYQIASSSCVFSNGTTTVTCTANVWYFADSAGITLSSYPLDSWTGVITVADSANTTATATSSPVNMGILNAINVTPMSINYGTLAPPQTSPTNFTTTVQNAGNCSTTIQLSALASLTGGIPTTTLATSSQQYATSSGFTFGTGYSLSSTAVTLSGFTLPAPISTTSVQGNVFWGLQIASGSPTGAYNGTTTFSALYSP